MRQILILGAGKSATVLIQTLLKEASNEDWSILVADGDIHTAIQKIGGNERGYAYSLDLKNTEQWYELIQESDLVISMLPPFFHAAVAERCLVSGKHFLNASYVSADIKKLHKEACNKGLLFLCEMGLDPGIDHMSAMDLIHEINEKGGKIISFRSHCGGLIAPESDDNPWHYKISWNPRNIITAGKDGARFLQNGSIASIAYENLFNVERLVEIPGLGTYAWYPNRDSLPYQDIYQLKNVHDFVRTTLRHPDFCKAWNEMVVCGFTSETELISTNSLTYNQYFHSKLNQSHKSSPTFNAQLEYIGAFEEIPINMGIVSPADILQRMLEKALRLKADDKDMVVMLHEIQYVLQEKVKTVCASLVIKGDNESETAMAKTVGLPLAIAAKLILNKVITQRGVQIPIDKNIYRPVLKELENNGIHFTITA